MYEPFLFSKRVIKWYSWMLYKFSFIMVVIIILHKVLGMSLSQNTPPCVCQYDHRMGTAFCPYVRACPEFVPNSQMKCAISEIILKPNTSLDQVQIHGECDNISAYRRLCMYAVKEKKMQSTGESFLCSGNFISFK